MDDSAVRLDALRRRVSQLQGLGTPRRADRAATGVAEVDARLGGGIERGQLHEIFAADEEDASSAAGFAAMLMLRVTPGRDALVWLRLEETQRRGGSLHAPGLVELGVDPARLVVGVLADPLSLLRVAAEVVACPQVGVAVIELWRNQRLLDLTATRRLAVAAQGSGATALLLRVAAEATPSAAHTRWGVKSAAAAPLEANAPGFSAFEISLLRQRGGAAGGCWQVEWDRDATSFRKAAPDRRGQRGAPTAAPLPGAVVPLAPGRTADTPRRRAG